MALTRDTDAYVSLRQRAQFANQERADLFVSIHVNSVPSQECHAVETYYLGPADDPRADFVGQPELDRVARRMHVEHLDQVPRIEADGDRLALIRDLQVLAGFALLRVARGQREHAGLQRELHAVRALARQERRAPKRRQQIVTPDRCLHPTLELMGDPTWE